VSASAETVARLEFPRRFLVPLYVGTAMNPINTSLIATALVPIAHAMHVSVGRTAVLVAGLYLASAVAQPTAGKLAEELGPRRVFTGGTLIVLLGGIVGGFAPNFTTLVISRALLGIGTSAGFPCSMLLIRRRAERAGLVDPPGGVIGGLSIAAQVVSTIGLPLGGVLEGLFGWRSVFFVNVPVAIAVLAMLLYGVPADVPAHRARDLHSLAMRIDAIGIVGFSGTLIALMVFLLSLPTPTWPALAISAAFAAFLVWWELRVANAFFDLRMLAGNLALTRTYVRMALITFGLYTVLYGMSQWLEDGRGLSALETGLLTMPMALVAAITGRIVSKRNLIRGSLLISAVASIVASAGVLFLTHSTPVAFFVAVTLVFGLSQGTTSFGNQGALYMQAPSNAIGTASGLLRTFGYLGAIASSAATGVVFRHGADDSGLHAIAWILVGTSVVVLLMTITDRALRGRQRIDLARAKAVPPTPTMETI
jgi:MFS family permease